MGAGKALPFLLDLGGLCGAVMPEEPVAEGKVLALLESVVAGVRILEA